MNERFTTRDLAELLANQTGMDLKRAEKFINALIAYISQGIERNKSVKIMGLGTFKVVLVRERESVHIQTGERFVIPAHHKLSFVPDKDFKDQINRPFAFFEPIETTDGHTPKKVSFKRDEENNTTDENVEEAEVVVSPALVAESDEPIAIEASEDDVLLQEDDVLLQNEYDLSETEEYSKEGEYTESVSVDNDEEYIEAAHENIFLKIFFFRKYAFIFVPDNYCKMCINTCF